MVNQNENLENLLVFPKFTQYSLVPIQLHGHSELSWTSSKKKKKNPEKTKQNKNPFQGSHFACVGGGRMVVMAVCAGGSVNGCMEVTGFGKGVLGWGGCVFGGVGGWVSEFWTSGIVCVC